ncbi:52 kDa repressor of the inhibitor of the protein kinase-like, partial [Aphis craccivora]
LKTVKTYLRNTSSKFRLVGLLAIHRDICIHDEILLEKFSKW